MPPFKKQDGTYTDDTKEKAEMMHEQFNMKRKENYYSDEMKAIHKWIDECIENDKFGEYFNEEVNDNIHILQRKINQQEIWKAISTLKRNNGMGCDWIHNIMIIEAKEVLVVIFEILFNKIINDGVHPKLWKLSEYVGMAKPKKSDVGNIRALQLTSVIDRIFQKVMGWRFITF